MSPLLIRHITWIRVLNTEELDCSLFDVYAASGHWTRVVLRWPYIFKKKCGFIYNNVTVLFIFKCFMRLNSIRLLMHSYFVYLLFACTVNITLYTAPHSE